MRNVSKHVSKVFLLCFDVVFASLVCFFVSFAHLRLYLVAFECVFAGECMSLSVVRVCGL